MRMAELNYRDPRDARREIKGDWRRRLFGPSRDEISAATDVPPGVTL